MGLAERFKTKLENKNIFERDIIEQKLEEKDIKFISKPVSGSRIEAKNGNIQPPVIIANGGSITEDTLTPPDKIPAEPVCGMTSENQTNKSVNIFDDLETELISKIRQTPYWDEYSEERRAGMISNYFNVKIKTSEYCGIEYTPEDKKNFTNTVLILTGGGQIPAEIR